MQLGQFMKAGRRIWLGSYTANSMPVTPEANGPIVLPIRLIDYWAGFGYETVMDWEYLDVWEFQEKIGEVKRLLSLNSLVLELPENPDQFAKQRRHWFSNGYMTEAADSFEKMISQLENRHRIQELKDLTENQSGEIPIWTRSKEFTEEPQFRGLKEELNLSNYASAADVIDVARTLGRLDVFEAFDRCMNAWLAKVHGCGFIFEPDGQMRRVSL